MQLYEDDEKGLFTFYREQADQEDELKHIKRQHKMESDSRKQETSRKLANLTDLHSKISENTHKRAQSNQPMSPGMWNQLEERQEKSQKTDQYQKMSIGQLLEKNKKGLKKNKNLAVILQNESSNEKSQQLKMHLSELMSTDLGSDSLNKMLRQQDQKIKLFADKKIHLNKANPFQKLALLPSNFESQIEDINLERNKQIKRSPKMLYSNSVEGRELLNGSTDKVSKVKQFWQKQDIPFLPKIDMKSNSQIMKKKDKLDISVILQQGKICRNNSRLIGDEKTKQMKSDNLRYNKEWSLNLDIAHLSPPTKRTSNQIYPIFQNKEGKNQQQLKTERERIFQSIVKKLKFT